MNSGRYFTSDLEIAAVLLSKGIKLLSIDKSNPRRANFIFEESPDIHSIVSEFVNGTLRLDPKLVFSSARVLKERIYARE